MECTVGEICRQAGRPAGVVGAASCTTRVAASAAAAAKVARPHQNHRNAGKEQRASESWRERRRERVNRKKHNHKKKKTHQISNWRLDVMPDLAPKHPSRQARKKTCNSRLVFKLSVCVLVCVCEGKGDSDKERTREWVSPVRWVVSPLRGGPSTSLLLSRSLTLRSRV